MWRTINKNKVNKRKIENDIIENNQILIVRNITTNALIVLVNGVYLFRSVTETQHGKVCRVCVSMKKNFNKSNIYRFLFAFKKLNERIRDSTTFRF